MEIYKIKIKGCETNVIFTGDKYYFYSSFYGPLAIAERKHSDRDINTEDFEVRIGNSYLGSKMDVDKILPAIKRFVTKCDSKYIQKIVNYTIVNEDLSMIHLKIQEI